MLEAIIIHRCECDTWRRLLVPAVISYITLSLSSAYSLMKVFNLISIEFLQTPSVLPKSSLNSDLTYFSSSSVVAWTKLLGNCQLICVIQLANSWILRIWHGITCPLSSWFINCGTWRRTEWDKRWIAKVCKGNPNRALIVSFTFNREWKRWCVSDQIRLRRIEIGYQHQRDIMAQIKGNGDTLAKI